MLEILLSIEIKIIYLQKLFIKKILLKVYFIFIGLKILIIKLNIYIKLAKY